MKVKMIAFLIVLLAAGIPAAAQKTEVAKPAKLPTVKEILDNYVKALGGRDAILKVKSRITTGTIELVPMNLKGKFEGYSAPEARSYTKMTIDGVGDLLEGSDGKTGWAINPIQGNRDKSGSEFLQSQLNANFYRDTKLDKLFSKIEVKGVEKVDGREAYVVSAVADGLPPETWYFDTQTGLMVRSDLTAISPEGNQPMSVFYEDMRKVDGILIPFRLRTQTTQFTMIMTATEVKHPASIDESKFAKPK